MSKAVRLSRKLYSYHLQRHRKLNQVEKYQGSGRGKGLCRMENMRFDYTPEESNSERNGMINSTMSRERRTHPRKPCFLSVNYATDDRAYQEFIQDISTTGVFIETRHLLPVGQNIAMTFSFPSRQDNIKLTGSVARTTPQGLGVAFFLQNDDQKKFLSSHIIDM